MTGSYPVKNLSEKVYFYNSSITMLGQIAVNYVVGESKVLQFLIIQWQYVGNYTST